MMMTASADDEESPPLDAALPPAVSTVVGGGDRQRPSGAKDEPRCRCLSYMLLIPGAIFCIPSFLPLIRTAYFSQAAADVASYGEEESAAAAAASGDNVWGLLGQLVGGGGAAGSRRKEEEAMVITLLVACRGELKGLPGRWVSGGRSCWEDASQCECMEPCQLTRKYLSLPPSTQCEQLGGCRVCPSEAQWSQQ